MGIWQSGQMHQTVNLTAQAYGGSNPSIPKREHAGVAQLARASAFQAEGREFESRFPLFCPGSSVVEHILGKDEVGGSTPLLGFQLI